MKRNDLILLLSVLLIACALLITFYTVLSGTGESAVITVDGEEILRLKLNEDTVVQIEGYQGGTNTIVVSDGKVSIQEASCPDLICVHTGEANEMKSIVCAPNRVVVRIEKK